MTGDPDGDPRLVLLLALGDDDLVLGHRHTSWTGVAPHLEEDLAFSSIAQDQVGHAVVWYTLAAEYASERAGAGAPGTDAAGADAAGGTAVDADALGLGRPPDGYRHADVCQRDNGDWAYTTARHLLYDLAKQVRLDAVGGSSWTAAADATGALKREMRHHLLHGRVWLARLANGPAEARERIVTALRQALPQAVGLFETPPGEDALLSDGTLPVAHADQLAHWFDMVEGELAPLGLDGIVDRTLTPSARAGRHGVHGEEFAELWEEMTGLYRSEPGATW